MVAVVVIVVINRGGGGGLISWLGIGVGAFLGSLADIKLGTELGAKPSILTIFPYKINNGTIELNDIRYKEDIVIPSIKNVGANKISILGKDIIITQIVIASFCCS